VARHRMKWRAAFPANGLAEAGHVMRCLGAVRTIHGGLGIILAGWMTWRRFRGKGRDARRARFHVEPARNARAAWPAGRATRRSRRAREKWPEIVRG
jgi:hypothetical protein